MGQFFLPPLLRAVPGMPTFRDYDSRDQEACLEIFDSNVPEYFAANERAEYEKFLNNLPGAYLVVEDHGSIVACGGFARHKSEPGAALLCWGMVTRERHGTGLGRQLLAERLRRLADDDSVDVIVANTSQLTEGFYSKRGFTTHRIFKDGLRPGLDSREMRLQLGSVPWTTWIGLGPL